jgi:hypothetical protein
MDLVQTGRADDHLFPTVKFPAVGFPNEVYALMRFTLAKLAPVNLNDRFPGRSHKRRGIMDHYANGVILREGENLVGLIEYFSAVASVDGDGAVRRDGNSLFI